MGGTDITTGVPEAHPPARYALASPPGCSPFTAGRPLLIQSVGGDSSRRSDRGVGGGRRTSHLPAQGWEHHLPVSANRRVSRGTTTRPVCSVTYYWFCPC